MQISTVWPSGLRRCVKAAVRKGVGSNPTAVTFVFSVHASKNVSMPLANALRGKLYWLFGLVV